MTTFQGLILPAHATSGTEDDYDDRDHEHADENEAPVRFLAGIYNGQAYPFDLTESALREL
jgi:hypothetical protein